MLEFSIKISLKFVPKGPINNIPALVQIMAWRRPVKSAHIWGQGISNHHDVAGQTAAAPFTNID